MTSLIKNLPTKGGGHFSLSEGWQYLAALKRLDKQQFEISKQHETTERSQINCVQNAGVSVKRAFQFLMVKQIVPKLCKTGSFCKVCSFANILKFFSVYFFEVYD